MTRSGPAAPHPPHILDSGLQNERTALAWTRTTLASAGCGLLLARLAAHTNWILGSVIAAGAVILAAIAAHATRGRYHRAAHAINNKNQLPDGRLAAIITSMLLLIGVGALTLLLIGNRA